VYFIIRRHPVIISHQLDSSMLHSFAGAKSKRPKYRHID
jgi:hypothetical protein